jgi:hypothetical protein
VDYMGGKHVVVDVSPIGSQSRGGQAA